MKMIAIIIINFIHEIKSVHSGMFLFAFSMHCLTAFYWPIYRGLTTIFILEMKVGEVNRLIVSVESQVGTVKVMLH